MENFWKSLVDYGDLIGQSWEGPAIVNKEKFPGAEWFPNARFNIAENFLRRRSDDDALVFWGEDKLKIKLSFNELHDQVSKLSQKFRSLGLKQGDTIAGYVPNMPHAIVATLAGATLGAVWSSCSPDFGVQGVLDRFSQVKPKLLIASDGYFYNGKTYDLKDKIEKICASLPSIEAVIIFSYTKGQQSSYKLKNVIFWDDILSSYRAKKIIFEQLPFNHPLYVFMHIFS